MLLTVLLIALLITEIALRLLGVKTLAEAADTRFLPADSVFQYPGYRVDEQDIFCFDSTAAQTLQQLLAQST